MKLMEIAQAFQEWLLLESGLTQHLDQNNTNWLEWCIYGLILPVGRCFWLAEIGESAGLAGKLFS